MESFAEIKEELLRRCTLYDRTIIGIWATDCLFSPAQNGRIFRYKFIVVQTNIGQGCAYSDHDTYSADYLQSLIGQDCLSPEIKDTALCVACMDSVAKKIYYNYHVKNVVLEGSSNDKLHLRTLLIIKEAERLVGNLQGKKILNVGVVGDILKGFHEKGCNVTGSDFDENIIGKKFFDEIPVESGNRTLELLTDMDLAIVTGMTITTKTLDSIIEVSKSKNVKLIVFAETGANLGQYYVHKGIDCYLGEEYPFYIFNGKSVISVTRNDR